MIWLKRILIGALFIYLLICIAVYFAQRKLLYIPPQDYLSPAQVGLPDMAELTLTPQTTSWWLPPNTPDKKTILFFHGNGSAVFSNHDIFADLIAQGHGVLSVGYPGYPSKDGISKQGPSQARITAAAIANYQFALDQNIAPETIVFFGTSLGSGAAAQLAAIHPPSLLIIDAPFNSILEMAEDYMRWLPVKLLMKDRFDSGKALAGLDIPIIWTHGTADSIVPLSQGQKLFDGYDGPKTAHIIAGGQHTNLWGLGAREIVLEALGQP